MYLDTSVLVAYYYPEAISHDVEKLLRRHSSPIVSELAEVEFSSAIARKVRQHECNRPDASLILAQFQKHLDNHLFTKLSLDSRHFQLAKTWLNQLEWSLRSLDALHLAAADISQALMVTADIAMAKTAEAIGVQALLIGPQTRNSKS